MGSFWGAREEGKGTQLLFGREGVACGKKIERGKTEEGEQCCSYRGLCLLRTSDLRCQLTDLREFGNITCSRRELTAYRTCRCA